MLDAIEGNGVNIQPSYYNNGNPEIGWDLMKQQPKIKTVRIEIEPDKAKQARKWIEDAKRNGFNVIATYHKASVLGSDNPSDLIEAADWWKKNYEILGGGFTINLMNEWGSHDLSASSYSTAYNLAIPIVRQVYDGNIIIDAPGWGQETHTAAVAADDIEDRDIILSAHIYPNGFNKARNHPMQSSDIDDIIASGRPCMIGEFGGGAGIADWEGIIEYARSKGLVVLGWCWNGDGNDLNMVSPSWVSDPTAVSFSLSPYFEKIYRHL
jgi:hypothetical protein